MGDNFTGWNNSKLSFNGKYKYRKSQFLELAFPESIGINPYYYFAG